MSHSTVVHTVPSEILEAGVTETRGPLNKRNKSLYRVGVAEIVLGGLSMLFAIIAMIITYSDAWRNLDYLTHPRRRFDMMGNSPMTTSALSYSNSAHGLWGGLFVVITGSLATRMKTHCTRAVSTANLIMAIVTTNVATAAFIVSVDAYKRVAYSPELLAFHALICSQMFGSIALAIIHAFLCCCGVCCFDVLQSTRRVLYKYDAVSQNQQ